MTPSFYQLPGRTAFSVAEVCARTGIGRDTIYDAVRTRKLAARKIGRRLIITERALHRFLESCRRRASRPDCAGASQLMTTEKRQLSAVTYDEQPHRRGSGGWRSRRRKGNRFERWLVDLPATGRNCRRTRAAERQRRGE